MRIDLNQELNENVLFRRVNEFINPADPLLKASMTVDEAIREIKITPREAVRYLYVVDEQNRFQGIITSKDLLFSSPDMLLSDILDADVVKAKGDDTLRESLEILSFYQLYSIPVVDCENHLLGILEIVPMNRGEERVSLLEQSLLYRDIFQFIGFSIEQHRWNSHWRGYRVRMPWLVCNLIAGLSCAGIAHVFQQSLVEFVILALFIPLVLTVCESVSTQSMTLIFQMLYHPNLRRSQVIRRLVVEWKTVLLLGITCSIGVGLATLLWDTTWKVMAVIGVSVFLSMLASASFGTLFPVLLHRFRLDPKVASGPLILMFTDISATTIYLGLATYFLVQGT